YNPSFFEDHCALVGKVCRSSTHRFHSCSHVGIRHFLHLLICAHDVCHRHGDLQARFAQFCRPSQPNISRVLTLCSLSVHDTLALLLKAAAARCCVFRSCLSRSASFLSPRNIAPPDLRSIAHIQRFVVGTF